MISRLMNASCGVSSATSSGLANHWAAKTCSTAQSVLPGLLMVRTLWGGLRTCLSGPGISRESGAPAPRSSI